ncbi:MAG TPA: hypothetical protein VNX68_18475, partial [Nitrosopumilaceae archaeon]|nr:hypothetical protein [Nitrosopumilaceae archaeon]
MKFLGKHNQLMATLVGDITSQIRSLLVSRNRFVKIAMMLAADSIALPICLFISLLLRLGNLDKALQYEWSTYLLIALLTILTFSLSGLYRAVIRFIDFRLLTTTGGGLAAVVFLTFLVASIISYDKQSNSALMIYWFVAFSYVVTSRLLVRSFLRTHGNGNERRKNVIAIYGAGERGAQLAVAMRLSEEYRPICFFDEKHTLDKRTVEGLMVFHSGRLVEKVREFGVDSIVIAVPSASPKRLLKIVRMMREARVSVKIQRHLIELSDDRLGNHSIRALKIEDLLGRDRVY